MRAGTQTRRRPRHRVRPVTARPRLASAPRAIPQDPSLAFVYGEHQATVKVAKFSPTGKYIASGGALVR